MPRTNPPTISAAMHCKQGVYVLKRKWDGGLNALVSLLIHVWICVDSIDDTDVVCNMSS